MPVTPYGQHDSSTPQDHQTTVTDHRRHIASSAVLEWNGHSDVPQISGMDNGFKHLNEISPVPVPDEIVLMVIAGSAIEGK